MRRFPASIWLFAVILALAISLPYVVGAVSATDGWRFTGAVPTPGGFRVDYNSHLAKMWQGSRGHWDYQLLFTHEAHPGLVTVQGFYVVLGALANFLPFDFTMTYHTARFALTVGMILAIWAFASRYFEAQRERWLAVLFGTITMGWGWLLLLFAPGLTSNVAPIEFWLIDAYNLLGAMFMPHFAAAVILQIVALLTFDSWLREEGAAFRALLVMTGALVLDAIIQPYVVLLTVPLIMILTAYHVFTARTLSYRRALWLVLPLGVHGGIVVWQYFMIAADPLWAEFTAQNITASPDLIFYLFGYLPFILPIAAGARRFMLERADNRWWLPILWVLIVAILLYAPFPTQRRYLLGVQTPLAVLAAYGWSKGVLVRFRPGLRPAVSIAYFALSILAPLLLIISNTASLSKPRENVDVFYQPDELVGYAWLRDNADPESLVLTTFDWSGNGSGGKLVAATGRRVYAGHWIETANFDDKIANLKRFYDPATGDSWRQQFLADIGADYVWFDAYVREQALGSWNPNSVNYLERVPLEMDEVTLFSVK